VTWEHFEHGADIGVRGRGASAEEAFEEAARAMTAVIADPSSVKERLEVAIACENPDLELLLADWLNALVFEMATRRLLFSRFRVRIRHGALRGLAWGEPVDRARHEPTVEVKGATYTSLRVAREEDGTWVAQCVVDV
jgi:protein archease